MGRQQTAQIVVNVLAIAFGLCTLPFIGEGLENVLSRNDVLWAVECLGMALAPALLAYGLWRRRRWAWRIALWVSVLAILLAPLLVIASAVYSFSANDATVVLALLVGILFGLVVWFLTWAETKELFGIAPDNREIVRILTAGGLVILCMVVGYAAWELRSHLVRKNADVKVVADIHELMEQRLAGLKADDPTIQHFGAFKEWQRGGWSRLSPTRRGAESLASRLETSGTARFEKEAVEVRLTITNGPKGIAFPETSNLNSDYPYWAEFWRDISASHPAFDLD